MMKRVLSLLLCLTMVLGFAVPTVQASGTDDIYISDDSLSNVIVGDNIQMDNVVIDGTTVTTPTEPVVIDGIIPGVPVEPALSGSSPVLAEPEPTVPADVAELFPEGSATETHTDGTIVSVEGIPEDGELSIQESDQQTKDIVAEFSTKQEGFAEELFSYDISVQDAQGEDWQPTGTVAMELEVPSAKLHKYAKVYIVHVDDNGVASTIEAQVTEDGKIAFETPGFSTFAGFTVDFEFEGTEFSINGYDSILLSELFDKLKAPLFVEDVAAVEFTNYNLIQVDEQADGDWLLTSLAAFRTTELLTITMDNGMVHEIVVTDAIYTTYPRVTIGGYGDYYTNQNTGDSNNGEEWTLTTYSTDAQLDNSHSEDYDIYVDATYATNKYFEFVLQHPNPTSTTKSILYLDLHTIWVRGGCNLTIRLGGTITNTNTSKIVITQVRGYKNNDSSKGWSSGELFWIESGSFELRPSYNDQSNVRIELTVQNAIYDGTYGYGHKALVAMREDCTSLKMDQVDVVRCKASAIDCKADTVSEITLTDCSFASGCNVSGNGGAFWLGSQASDSSAEVNIQNFTLTGCSFNGTTASDKGGAIFSKADIANFKIENCTFNGCTATGSRGGAIEIQPEAPTADNHIFDSFLIKGTSFINCSAGSHGGAIQISVSNDPIKLSCGLEFNGCTFTNCQANGGRGGALRLVMGLKESGANAGAQALTLKGCVFSGNSANSHGGAVSVQGMLGTFGISEGTYFENNTAKGNRGGAIAVLCDAMGDITVDGSATPSGKYTFSGNTAGSLGGAINIGKDGATAQLTGGALSFTQCSFKSNFGAGHGGSISVSEGQYSSFKAEKCSFEDSDCYGYGGGICLYANDSNAPFNLTGNVDVLQCSFTDCDGGMLAVEAYDHDDDPDTPDVKYWDHDGNPDTEVISHLNGVSGAGGIAIGGTIAGNVTISGESGSVLSAFTNCTTWNNGGAIALLGDLVTRKITLKWLMADKCMARDAGNAFHFSNLIAENVEIYECTVQDCTSFWNYYLDNGKLPDGVIGDTLTDTVVDQVTRDANGNITAVTYKAEAKRTYTVEDVYAYDASGTIRSIGNTSCTLLIYNCSIDRNKSYSNGGGVYWNANKITDSHPLTGKKITPTLTVQFCDLDGNYAMRDGGGLYCEATINIISSIFRNNIAAGRGGGIAQQVYNNNSREFAPGEACNLSLNSDTTIYSNRANHGGGISITVSKTVSVPDGTNVIYPVKFTLGGAQVYDNKAITNGGGIYYATTRYDGDALGQREVDNFEKIININDGKIYSNIAGYSNAEEGITSEGGSGGGIYMDSNQVNTADSLTDGTKTGCSQVTISSGSIYNNIAYSGNGGGIYLQGINAECIVTGGAIGFYRDANNAIVKYPNMAIPLETVTTETVDGKEVTTTTYSRGNGGGIAIYGGASIRMTAGEVYYNEAYVGGGIAVRDGSFMVCVAADNVVGAQIKYNSATSAGGGIAVHDDSQMILYNGNVQENTAAYGGGISVMSSGDASTIRPVDEEGKPLGKDADGNVVDAEGNIIEEKWGMIISGGVVQHNIASILGAGICLSDNSTMQFNTGYISANYTATVEEDGTHTYSDGQEGGGMAVCQGSLMDVYYGVIQYNQAADGAGAVVRGGSTLNMFPSDNSLQTCSIVSNISHNRGGGVYCVGSTFNLYGGRLLDNDALYGGGGFFDDGSTFFMQGGTVEKNEATWQGGGLFLRKATATIEGGTIQTNSATTNGGGIRVDGSGGVTIKGGTITGNTAGEGAGLWIKYVSNNYGKPTVEIYGGEITKNIANKSGGGIFIHGGNATGTDLKMYGGTIKENEAGERGGGINADDLATVLLSVYTNEDGEVTRPEVTLNKAARGGGIFVCYGAELTVNEGFITFNHAVGKNSLETAWHECDNLVGTGGGIAVAAGRSSSQPAKFTLEGKNMAIYGNIADFAADDVFASGSNTVLSIPQVSKMNLSGYNFKPEAWFEDYAVDDDKYTSGTNLGSELGITNGNVYRYRGASSGHRVLIDETNITAKVNTANTYVCMTLGIPAAVADTVVIDYGLPVKINVIDNDVILSLEEMKTTGTLGSTAPSVDNAEKIFETNGVIYGVLDSNFEANTSVLNNLKHGTAKIDRNTGMVVYQINSDDFAMNSEDTFYYAVYHEVPTSEGTEATGYYYYGKVQVIPATTLYFEDNFGTAITYDGNWENAGDAPDLTDIRYAQSQDRVGASVDLDLDADNVYGFDPRYDRKYTHSFGSAKKVNVSEGNDASAVFTFTGTGFDIISHCSKQTGTILVNVYEGTEVASDKLITSYMVDSYYGYALNYYKLTYTYGNNGWTVESESITKNQMGESQKFPEKPKTGDVVVIYQAKFEPGTSSVAAMYQIPVMKTDLTKVIKSKDNPDTEVVEPTVYCTYGTYTVQVYVAWSWWADHEQYGYGSWDFYLDGIRIYNPADDGVYMDANGEVNTVIRDAYVADNEGWPRYDELRNLMISANEFSSISDANVSGSIFIDTNGGLNNGSEGTTTFPDGSALSGKLPAIVDYANLGPNNELYLTDGQGIAFHLDTGAADLPEGVEIASVQIGLKSCSGSSYAKVYNASTTTFADAPSIDLNSTSDRYYDITTMDGGDVVIYCSSAYSCMSITNVKITYTADPYGTASGNVTGGSGSTTPPAGQIFTISADSARNALGSFLTEEETVPTLTLKYPTLSFEGEICYDIFFDAQDLGSLTAADMGLAVFTTEDTEGTVDTAYDVIYGTQLMDGLYMVSTNGIAAKDMGDRLYFKAFAKLSDGSYVYSDMRSYSAVDYATNTLANSNDAAQKALVVAMLNYGAQAQTFFGHNTDSLMNAGLTAEDQTLVSGFNASTLNALTPADATKTAAFVANGGFSGKYPAVFFDGAFEINYNVVPENAVEGSMILYCWSEDTYNSADALTVENADQAVLMLNTDGVWSACSQQIAAKDLDKTVYAAAVYESQGESFCTGILPYSIATYCQDLSADTTSDMGALANAAAIYGCAAKAYFG